jgi:hypothetical protein
VAVNHRGPVPLVLVCDVVPAPAGCAGYAPHPEWAVTADPVTP